MGAGLGFHIILCGMLFRLMYWPGAGACLMVGLLTLIPLSIGVYLLGKNNTKPELDDYYRRLFWRCGIITVAALLLFVLPMMGVTVLPANYSSPH